MSMSSNLRLNSELICDRCGSKAVISYVAMPYKGPEKKSAPPGERSASWTYIIDCPKCGRREQRPLTGLQS
jgi:hypothetical protein